MIQPQIFEGTAQEIVDQIRRSNLSGKLKVIITPDEYEAPATNGTVETLDIALASLLEEADRIQCETPPPPTDPQKAAFGETVTENTEKWGSNYDAL